MSTRAQSAEEAAAEREREEAQAKANADQAAKRRRDDVRAVSRRLDSLRLAVLEAQTDPDMPDDRLTGVLTDCKGQFLAAVSELRALRFGTEDQAEPDPVLPFGLAGLPLAGHPVWDGLDDLLSKRAVNHPSSRKAQLATLPEGWDLPAAA